MTFTGVAFAISTHQVFPAIENPLSNAATSECRCGFVNFRVGLRTRIGREGLDCSENHCDADHGSYKELGN